MTSASTFSDQDPIPEPAAEGATEAPLLPTTGLDVLPVRRPPKLEGQAHLHGRTPAGDEVVVIISQLALRQVAMHAGSNTYCEVGGALLGRAFRWQDQAYVDVLAAIPAVTADQGPIHFTFTADAWAQLHKDRTERFPDLDIVGWFHTHPDLGVFYSSDDVVVHSAAFTQPWHVGLVVDPLRGETSFFGWRNHELAPISGFYERLDLQPESQSPWRAIETAVWDHPYEYEYDEEQPAQPNSVYLPPNQRPSLPALKTYVGYTLGAVGLLLSLILLLGWVLPLTREVDRLQNTVLVLADTALADSNAAACPDMSLRILSPVHGQQWFSGQPVEITGTAMVPEATRYQVDVRPSDSQQWTVIGQQRGEVKLGELATWNTAEFAPGVYTVRLSAVDNNNIRLAGSPDCAIALELSP